MTNKQAYKYKEIKSHFEDFINENGEDWVNEYKEDLHHKIFNTDYYIIGRFEATKWLGDQVFNVINIIKEYENDDTKELGRVGVDRIVVTALKKSLDLQFKIGSKWDAIHFNSKRNCIKVVTKIL